MKLQQLRYIWEVAHHDLNVSTAQSLSSQPGISKQIRLLEDELGVEVFARSGKHLTRVTPAGSGSSIPPARSCARSRASSRSPRNSPREEGHAVHRHYPHPGALCAAQRDQRLHQAVPGRLLHMHQGTPMQIAEMAADGTVDFAIATEALELFGDLIMMPCYRWNRCVIVPHGHPLTKLPKRPWKPWPSSRSSPTCSASPAAPSTKPSASAAWCPRWYSPRPMPT